MAAPMGSAPTASTTDAHISGTWPLSACSSLRMLPDPEMPIFLHSYKE